MKKRNVFSGLILTLMFCGEVNAQVITFVGNGSNRVGGNSSTSRTISTDAQRGQTNGLYTTCKGPDYMKLSYLRNLFSEPEAFKVSINESQTSLEIEYPEFIGNCMELKFDVQYINNNAVVKAFNEKFSNDYDADGRIVKSSFQKYLDCLKVEGILTNVGTDAEPSFQFNANHTNVSRVSASRVSMPIRDGALERGKDVKAYFLSPKSVTTGAFAPAFEVSKPSFDNTCYYTERVNSNENNIVYMSPASRARQSVYEACVSKNYKRILSALRNLDSNTVGNYKLLKDTLEKALIKSLEGESDKVYEQMRALAKDVEFDDKGEPNIDSEDSVDLLEDYADILRELNRKVLTPYISRIDDLLTERAKAKTREEKRAIDKLIKQYKDKIKQYSKRANTLGYNKMMKLARYYGHTGEGRDIEGFRLKSHIYGHMKETIKHPTKNKKTQISFKKAGEVINDALDHFDAKVANVWEKEAASRRGDATAALSARSRHQSLSKARDQRYRSDMQSVGSDYKKCVGWFQTQFKVQKCQQKAKKTQQRAMQRRAYYNKQIGQASSQYNHYNSFYEQYQRSVASSNSGLPGFNDPFGLYNDPFSSNIDPTNYYNMGMGNNTGMNSGFNPFGTAGMGMNYGMQGMGMNGMNGMGMMPGYQPF